MPHHLKVTVGQITWKLKSIIDYTLLILLTKLGDSYVGVPMANVSKTAKKTQNENKTHLELQWVALPPPQDQTVSWTQNPYWYKPSINPGLVSSSPATRIVFSYGTTSTEMGLGYGKGWV